MIFLFSSTSKWLGRSQICELCIWYMFTYMYVYLKIERYVGEGIVWVGWLPKQRNSCQRSTVRESSLLREPTLYLAFWVPVPRLTAKKKKRRSIVWLIVFFVTGIMVIWRLRFKYNSGFTDSVITNRFYSIPIHVYIYVSCHIDHLASECFVVWYSTIQ